MVLVAEATLELREVVLIHVAVVVGRYRREIRKHPKAAHQRVAPPGHRLGHISRVGLADGT
ncbi:MAG: hypothetical protein ACYTF1_12385 [Planctomycetota bacterium]|jgi:hypothetical protein